MLKENYAYTLNILYIRFFFLSMNKRTLNLDQSYIKKRLTYANTKYIKSFSLYLKDFIYLPSLSLNIDRFFSSGLLYSS